MLHPFLGLRQGEPLSWTAGFADMDTPSEPNEGNSDCRDDDKAQSEQFRPFEYLRV